MQPTTMVPQSSVVEPLKLGNVQLVIAVSIHVLTWSSHSKNEYINIASGVGSGTNDLGG